MTRVQRYLLREDAARALGVTVRALEAWASKGTGPAYRKHGKRVVYGEMDLAEWSDAQTRTSTAQESPANHAPTARKAAPDPQDSAPEVVSVASGAGPADVVRVEIPARG